MQLRLFREINNHQEHVAAAVALITHLSTGLRLHDNFISRFKLFKITEPICGFHVTDFPLWKLANLLDENWLEEDVVNALSELLYLRLAATSIKPVPSFVYLSTSFFVNARLLYHQQPREYSPEIICLRERLRQTNVSDLAFIVWHENHYAAYFHHQFSSHVSHGDSMALPPASDIEDIYRWIVSDLCVLPPSIRTEPVALQSNDAGTGSCAIAAHNFIESRVDDRIPSWSSERATLFRDAALRDLIVYHCIATDESEGVSSSCSSHELLLMLICLSCSLSLTGLNHA